MASPQEIAKEITEVLDCVQTGPSELAHALVDVVKPRYHKLREADPKLYEEATRRIGRAIFEEFDRALRANPSDTRFSGTRRGYEYIKGQLGLDAALAGLQEFEKRLEDRHTEIRQGTARLNRELAQKAAAPAGAEGGDGNGAGSAIEFFIQIRRDIPTRGRHKDGLSDLASSYNRALSQYGIGPGHPARDEATRTRKKLVDQRNALAAAGERVASIHID